MLSDYRIIVSAENSPYMAWQCKLFHYSCVSRLGVLPAFVVHETGEEWHEGFRDIVRAGGRVRAAPNYCITAGGIDYPPRNAAGTLFHADEVCDERDEFIVLCDPDMLFVRPPEFPRALSGDSYPPMNYDHPAVRRAARNVGISAAALNERKHGLRFGVPHVIPRSLLRPVAETWLEVIDAFPPRLWEISMYAFGLMSIKLDVPVTLTYFNDHNSRPRKQLKGDMIHYCYSADPAWRKHEFMTTTRAPEVWEPDVTAPRGTVLGEILAQIREARQYYRGLTF